MAGGARGEERVEAGRPECLPQRWKGGGEMDFDVIVIGSGFGGAITACRLAEANYRVLILERGRRWDRTTYPREARDPWLWDQAVPEHLNGWLDLRFFPSMAVAAGAGVGGGSLVYANVSMVPPADAFEAKPGLASWPREITHAELAPYYERVARFMDVQKVPENQWNPRMHLVREAAEALGYGGRFRPLDLAIKFDPELRLDCSRPPTKEQAKFSANAQGVEQGTCYHCGRCDIGCEVDARSTLDMNYIPWAERHGAEVRPLHLVKTLEPLEGGYRVFYDRLESGRRIEGSVTGRRVIVAAGSLGSTELLLRCRDETGSLPRISGFLGRNWSSNGDFLTPALYERGIDPSCGPTINCVIDFLDGKETGGQALQVEDGGFPDVLAERLEDIRRATSKGAWAWLLFEALRQVARHDPTKHVMPWFAQGVDAGDGVFSLKRPWWLFGSRRLHLTWDVSRSEPVFNAIVDMHKRLSRATGGEAYQPITWTLGRDLITPHPLGGCNMGDTVASGVVDHAGRVFNYPNLYVADAAIIPRAIGVNPSRTIGALAERIAALIGREGR